MQTDELASIRARSHGRWQVCLCDCEHSSCFFGMWRCVLFRLTASFFEVFESIKRKPVKPFFLFRSISTWIETIWMLKFQTHLQFMLNERLWVAASFSSAPRKGYQTDNGRCNLVLQGSSKLFSSCPWWRKRVSATFGGVSKAWVCASPIALCDSFHSFVKKQVKKVLDRFEREKIAWSKKFKVLIYSRAKATRAEQDRYVAVDVSFFKGALWHSKNDQQNLKTAIMLRHYRLWRCLL